MALRAATAGALVLLVTGCVSTTRPPEGSCAATEVTVEVAIDADGMTPSDPSACRGQQLTLEVTSSVPGVFHIHGYDSEIPATAIEADDPVSLEFDAVRSGQFPIELHTQDAPEGASLGILTVHEP